MSLPKALLLAALLLSAASARAEPGLPLMVPADDEPTFSFVWENDRFASTDRNYTNGVRLSYLSATRRPDALGRFAIGLLVGEDEPALIRRGFAIGHSIFTPQDKQTTAPLPDQHPYAGWLYGEYAALIQTENAVHQLSLQAGIVGPSALGEEIQNGFHDLVNADPVLGWDNQIRDEIGGTVAYDYMNRIGRPIDFGDLSFDVTPSLGVAIGSIQTYVKAGANVRLGSSLASDFGPPRVRPSLAGSGFFTPSSRFSWYVFAGVEGRAVAHNIFLDGSLFRSGDPNVPSKALVGDVQLGLVLQLGDVQAGYTWVLRSKEFDGQTRPQLFGAGSLSWRF